MIHRWDSALFQTVNSPVLFETKSEATLRAAEFTPFSAALFFILIMQPNNSQ